MPTPKEPKAPTPDPKAAPAKKRAKKRNPHAFHPELHRDHTVISPAGGNVPHLDPGAVPMGPENHESSE